MDSLWEILLVITVAAVAALIFVVAFLRDKVGSRKRKKSLPPTSGTGSSTSTDTGGGGGTSTIERKPPKKNTYSPRSGMKIDTGGTSRAGGASTLDTPAKTDGAGAAGASAAPTGSAAGAEAQAADAAAGTDEVDQLPGSRPIEPTEIDPAVSAATSLTPAGATEASQAEPEVDAEALETDLDPDAAATAPDTETPESARGRMTRLRSRLAKSNSALGQALLKLLAGGHLDEEAWEEVEDTLLAADLGVEATTEVVDALRTRVAVAGQVDVETVRGWLSEELLKQVDPDADRRIAATRVGDRPAVVLVVGVNGTGKTTTVGKLARVLVAEDKDVLLGAADTFRAAAADQLETWGARVGVATVRSDKEGADPASVAYDAVKAGLEGESDVVLLDTAGRLHNKSNLMDELSKIKRVVEKLSPIDEVLLVLDATTGQNGLRQAEVFGQAVDVSGVVLTKLDGTAKGGIVVAVQRQLGVPVKLVGLGEGPDDLAPFDPAAFVDAVLD